MRKVIRWLDLHCEETILVVLLAVISVVELMQVVARNVPFIPSLTWAEELCRFAWIATVFLSLPYTIRTSNILRVSALIDQLPAMLHNLLNVIVDIVTFAMMAVLAWASVSVLERIAASGETSPAMLMPMWIMYLIVLIGFVAGALRSVQMAVIHIIHFRERPITEVEKLQAQDVDEEFVVPALLDMEDAPDADGADAAKAAKAAQSAQTAQSAQAATDGGVR